MKEKDIYLSRRCHQPHGVAQQGLDPGNVILVTGLGPRNDSLSSRARLAVST